MKYFCYQGNNNDCGFASLKMLLAILNKNKSYLYLDKPEKRSDYTFKDLIEIGKSYSLKLKAYSCDPEMILLMKLPCLALLDCNHCVVVAKFKKGIFTVHDPYRGIIKIKEEAFIKRWSGKYLEVEEFTPVDLLKKERQIMPVGKNALSFIIASLSVVSLLVGFFFIKDNSYVFIPIIFLALFSILELVEKWYLIKEIKFFDNLYIPIIFNNKISSYKEQYRSYLEFKKGYFSHGRKIFISCVFIGLITVTLILNNPMYGLAVLGFLLIAVIEKVVMKDKDEDSVKEIEDMETTLIKNDNANIVEDLLLISGLANDHVLKISVRKCINTFVILIISFILMFLEQVVSVNFILFHFGVFYILFDNIEIALTFSEKNKSYQLAKARFLDLVNI